MSFEKEYIEDIQTVIITVLPDFMPQEEGEQPQQYAEEIRAQYGLERLFFVVDFRQKQFSFDEIVAMAHVARKRSNILPELEKAIVIDIIITDNQALTFAAKGMNSAAFGNLPIRVFGTRDETFAFIRSQL